MLILYCKTWGKLPSKVANISEYNAFSFDNALAILSDRIDQDRQIKQQKVLFDHLEIIMKALGVKFKKKTKVPKIKKDTNHIPTEQELMAQWGGK